MIGEETDAVVSDGVRSVGIEHLAESVAAGCGVLRPDFRNRCRGEADLQLGLVPQLVPSISDDDDRRGACNHWG